MNLLSNFVILRSEDFAVSDSSCEIPVFAPTASMYYFIFFFWLPACCDRVGLYIVEHQLFIAQYTPQ